MSSVAKALAKDQSYVAHTYREAAGSNEAPPAEPVEPVVELLTGNETAEVELMTRNKVGAAAGFCPCQAGAHGGIFSLMRLEVHV